MATYYDALNDFHKLNEQEPLASSAQLLYLHLLHKNNRLGNRGLVQVSDRMLELTTRLSKQSITNAKRILKSCGLIDFKTDKASPRTGTTYILKFFADNPGQNPGQNAGQNPGQNPGQNSRSNTNLKIVYKKEEEKEKDSLLVDKLARTRDFQEMDYLSEYWSDEIGGGRLTFEHLAKIRNFVERYGVEWVKAAMDESANVNHDRFGVKPKLLFAILDSKANPKIQPKIVKGAESIGSNSSGNFKRPPADNGNEPWASF